MGFDRKSLNSPLSFHDSTCQQLSLLLVKMFSYEIKCSSKLNFNSIAFSLCNKNWKLCENYEILRTRENSRSKSLARKLSKFNHNGNGDNYFFQNCDWGKCVNWQYLNWLSYNRQLFASNSKSQIDSNFYRRGGNKFIWYGNVGMG